MDNKNIKMERYSIITSYVVILKRVINFYHERCPNKDSSYTHIRRARVFMDADPKSVVEVTGSKLYKYKEIILAKRPDKIVHTADEEKEETLKEYTAQKDIAAKLVENILQVWRHMNAQDKNDLAEQLIEMLRLYIQYLITEK